MECANGDALSMVAVNPRMLELQRTVSMLAPKRMPVLIVGETGVGKEALVHLLHAGSGRPGPLKTINCGAIPRELSEALLFGHERGAFTGAERRNRGLFEEAHRGTLFLDEIGELSLDTQAALLRVLQTRRVTRLGSADEVEVDVRITAATHQDLERRVGEGTFREDLFYRIHTVTLRVPPLRERPQEILPFARYFLAQAAAEQESPVRGLSEEALACLRTYRWPGNVRELRNAIERAVAFCEGTVIEVADLPPAVSRQSTTASPPRPCPLAPTRGIATIDDTEHGSFKERVRAFEIQLIMSGLQRSHGNVTKTAELLRIPIRTLTHKMGVYDLRAYAKQAPHDYLFGRL
jgi:DNA-binding NtrC family response regulator